MSSLVKFSNSITRASYAVSLPEKRLLMLAISRIRDDDSMISIAANDYADFFSLNRDGIYRTLKSASEKLWTRTLVINDGTKYRWIITSRYNTGKGVIELEFHPKLKPHLLELQGNFTQYLLQRAADFKLMYTWRLFELMMQFRTTGFVVISLESFNEALDVPSTYARDFGKIREKVIQPAIKEIIEKDGLDVTWKTNKQGRKVTTLEFKFTPEQQSELPLPVPPTDKPKVYTREDLDRDSNLARPGESYEQALRRLNSPKKEKA